MNTSWDPSRVADDNSAGNPAGNSAGNPDGQPTERFQTTEQFPPADQLPPTQQFQNVVAAQSGDEDAGDRARHAAEPSGDIEVRPKRSGRNMVAAVTVGLVMLGVVLGSAWFHPAALAVVIYVACIAAIMEWRRALAQHDREVPLVPVLAATLGMGVATYFGLAEGLAVALLVGCAGVVAWRVVDERIENTLADSLASMMTLLWIPFLASFILLMGLAEDGWVRVLIVVLAVVGSDTGALYTGMAIGKRPLAPAISPKKTWEGAIGGLVVGTAAAAVAAYYLLDGQWWIGAGVGAIACVAGVVGDLAESAIKRDMQVKDMSHALPGHGGVLDRMDSMLVAAPVAYVLFALLWGTT